MDLLKEEKSESNSIHSNNSKGEGYKHKPISANQFQENKSLVMETSMISSYTVSKAPNISCKVHGQTYIGVDILKFKLTCKKCFEMGVKASTNLEMIESVQNPQQEDEDADITCQNHPETEGIFYCDECKFFLCKNCFANAHRMHNSNLPKLIGTKFKESLQERIVDCSKIKPRIEESLEQITKVNNEINKIREKSNKSCKDLVNKISINVKAKFDKLGGNQPNIYQGLDVEVDNVCSRLSGLGKKLTKYIQEFRDFSNKIENSNLNSTEICTLKKSKHMLFKDIMKAFEDSKNLREFKLEKVKHLFIEKKAQIEKEFESSLRQVKILEKSIITSIQSGTTNNSIILRRFTRFNRKGVRYYKSSSLQIKADKPVFLCGLGLCSLYISSKKFIDPKSNVVNNMEERGVIHLNVEVSEILNLQNEKNGSNLVRKLSENHQLYGIVNKTDPTAMLYFKKVIFLKANTKYLITLNNLESNHYIDIWAGEVGKISQNLEQQLTCNVSGNNFTFYSAEGIESDFNEFNLGIIANIIYSESG
jgi:hypothetical protein